ncbi:MAG: histidine ammonia-lyase, partial [Enterobacterales bacterium]
TKEYKLSLDPACFAAIEASTKTVADIIADKKTVYGINTGFGLLASTRIEDKDLSLLQRSLVLSHSTGLGRLLDDDVVALIMLLKINSLSRGFSGIRLEVIQLLIELFNRGIYPCIPAKGSVGASGDLAPLAHMSCALIGESEVRFKGEILPADQVLAEQGLKPVLLGPKEGLALLNGTNVSTALALKGLFWAENNFSAALVAGAMSVDAAMGSSAPFDERIHFARGHQGQIDVAKVYRELLEGSIIKESHANCDRVQDPYSLRCQPQVMGACLDQMRYTASVMLTEANAVSDNPLVFSDSGDILSGGNFHAEPIALSSDTLATSMCEVGSISERRVALLLDQNLSNLPAFLVENSGVNSGFMIAQVTAAALASENKSLAHPASVDSIPTSANQEDHVSMATFAARRLSDIAENVTGILAVECLAAAQGIDLRKPLQTSPLLKEALEIIRSKVSFYEADRYFADDLNQMSQIIRSGELTKLVSLKLN